MRTRRQRNRPVVQGGAWPRRLRQQLIVNTHFDLHRCADLKLVDIFGGHVDRRFDVGQVIAEPGPLAASADTFAITLVDRGAHGARPTESADAVVAAAAVITALQTIVARRLDPAAPAICTVGSVHAGVAANVIPEKATLTGTLRAMDPVTRRRLGEEVTRLATQVGEAYGVRADAIIKANAPELSPKTWYGMPAYANRDGKVICFFQSASKFKVRYATFGFQPDAHLDDGTMWPTSFAITELTPEDEARIADLVKKAVR